VRQKGSFQRHPERQRPKQQSQCAIICKRSSKREANCPGVLNRPGIHTERRCPLLAAFAKSVVPLCPRILVENRPSVISQPQPTFRILDQFKMPISSPQQAPKRAPRTSFSEITHAVLRCQNGSRVLGRIQIISVTGGLLGLEKPLNQGSQVKLMFLTDKGSVYGTAEMLRPLSWIQQPFRFTKLHDDDQQRLNAAIQFSLDQGRRDVGQMERFRAW
jgi:hypothetical protein